MTYVVTIVRNMVGWLMHSVLPSLKQNVLWACCYSSDFNHKMQLYVCDCFTALCTTQLCADCWKIMAPRFFDKDTVLSIRRFCVCLYESGACAHLLWVVLFSIPSQAYWDISVCCSRFRSKIPNPKCPETPYQRGCTTHRFLDLKILIYLLGFVSRYFDRHQVFNCGFSSLF
jgi:hypothetical protein